MFSVAGYFRKGVMIIVFIIDPSWEKWIILILIIRIPSKSYGQRSFFYAASSLWNNLPQQIRTADNVNIFKSLLKTHLFNAVYSWLYLI